MDVRIFLQLLFFFFSKITLFLLQVESALEPERRAPDDSSSPFPPPPLLLLPHPPLHSPRWTRRERARTQQDRVPWLQRPDHSHQRREEACSRARTYPRPPGRYPKSCTSSRRDTMRERTSTSLAQPQPLQLSSPPPLGGCFAPAFVPVLGRDASASATSHSSDSARART